MTSTQTFHETMGPFDALIFDQDGTLLDAEANHCAAWCAVAAELEVPFDEQVFSGFAGKGDPAIAAHVSAQVCRPGDDKPSASLLVERKRTHYKARIDELQLMPGALAFLQAAKQAGATMAMATISPEDETMRVVRRHNLDLYLAEIVHRESEVPNRPGEVVRSKPAPDIYLAAAALLGVEPPACCAFEDSLTGVRAAKAAGMRVIAIPTRYSRHFDYSAADLVVDSFDQLRYRSGSVIVEAPR